MDDDIKRKYAKMFIDMSTAYLMDGITWDTFVSNVEIAARLMQSVETPSNEQQMPLHV
jgi:hypothetical protein